MAQDAMRRRDRLGIRLMSLLVTLVPVSVAAQESRTAPARTPTLEAGTVPAEAARAVEAAVAQRYPDLQSRGSRAALQATRGDREHATALAQAVRMLRQGNPGDAALASTLRPLLEGATEAEAVERVGAVLLAYYEEHVRTSASTESDAIAQLEGAAEAMASAAINAMPSAPPTLRAPIVRR